MIKRAEDMVKLHNEHMRGFGENVEFDRECCVWKFKKAETELWRLSVILNLRSLTEMLR